jgi:hypothetical protein
VDEDRVEAIAADYDRSPALTRIFREWEDTIWSALTWQRWSQRDLARV